MHWDPLNSEDVPLNEYLEKNIGEFITIKFPKTEHVGKLIRISPDYKFVTIKWDSRTGTQEFPVEQVVYEPTSRMRSRVKTSFLINDEKIFINKPKKERLARKPKKEKRVAISYKVEGEDQCDDDHDDEDEGESEDSHDEDFVDLMSDDKEPINKRRYRTKASRNGNGPIGGKKNIADDSSKEKRRRIKTSIHVNERPVLVERQKEKMNERIHKKRKVDHEYPSKLIMEDSRTQSTSEVKSLRVERPQDHKHGERKEEEYEIPSPRDRLTNDDDSTITNELNNQSLADFSEHVIDLDSSDWTIQRVGHDPNEKFITDDLNNIFTVLDTEKVMFDHESRVDGKRNDTHVNQGAKKSRVIFAALEKPNVDVKGCSEKGHLQSLPHSKKECPIDEVKHHRQDRIDVNTNASTFQVRLDEIQAVNRLDEYATVREPLIDDSEAGINEHVGDIETKPLPEGHTYSDMLSTRFHTPSDNRTQRSDAAPASYRTPTFTPDIMVTQHVADLFCFISDLVTLAKMPYNNNASDNDDRSDGSKLRLIKPLIAAKLKLPLNIYRESTISSEFFEQKLKPIISGKEFPFTSLTSIPRHHLFEKESSANSFSEYNIPSSESIEDILFASLCFRSLDSLSTFEVKLLILCSISRNSFLIGLIKFLIDYRLSVVSLIKMIGSLFEASLPPMSVLIPSQIARLLMMSKFLILHTSL